MRFCKHCSASMHGSEECGESYQKRPNEEQVGGSKMLKMAKSDVLAIFRTLTTMRPLVLIVAKSMVLIVHASNNFLFKKCSQIST